MTPNVNPLWSLVLTFGLMSLFAVGGANAAIPEMRRIAVDIRHWMTDREFADIYAISQLSPGPNVLIVTLIGYTIAGITGALAATLAMCTDGSACLFCEPLAGAIARVAMADDRPNIAGAAVHRLDGGERPDRRAGRRPHLGRGARDTRGRRAGRLDKAQPALALAHRRMLGFRWRYLRKAARQ
jgi:hypothetical protein